MHAANGQGAEYPSQRCLSPFSPACVVTRFGVLARSVKLLADSSPGVASHWATGWGITHGSGC